VAALAQDVQVCVSGIVASSPANGGPTSILCDDRAALRRQLGACLRLAGSLANGSGRSRRSNSPLHQHHVQGRLRRQTFEPAQGWPRPINPANSSNFEAVLLPSLRLQPTNSTVNSTGPPDGEEEIPTVTVRYDEEHRDSEEGQSTGGLAMLEADVGLCPGLIRAATDNGYRWCVCNEVNITDCAAWNSLLAPEQQFDDASLCAPLLCAHTRAGAANSSAAGLAVVRTVFVRFDIPSRALSASLAAQSLAHLSNVAGVEVSQLIVRDIQQGPVFHPDGTIVPANSSTSIVYLLQILSKNDVKGGNNTLEEDTAASDRVLRSNDTFFLASISLNETATDWSPTPSEPSTTPTPPLLTHAGHTAAGTATLHASTTGETGPVADVTTSSRQTTAGEPVSSSELTTPSKAPPLTTTEPRDSSSVGSSGTGLSQGLVAGIVSGALVVTLIVGGVVLLKMRRARARAKLFPVVNMGYEMTGRSTAA
jgi:hypothetical protein